MDLAEPVGVLNLVRTLPSCSITAGKLKVVGCGRKSSRSITGRRSEHEKVSMRWISMSDACVSLVRVRTPGVISLTRDLKSLIVLLNSVLRHR